MNTEPVNPYDEELADYDRSLETLRNRPFDEVFLEQLKKEKREGWGEE